MDRDGTLVKEVGFLERPEQLEILPHALDAVEKINQKGALAVVVTNQSGVARGILSEEQLKEIHSKILQDFEAAGAPIARILYCPHHPSGHPPYNRVCLCRKPAPGLILQARRELDIDLARSVMIGDKLSDLGAARRAGCSAVLVLTGYGDQHLSQLQSGDITEDPKLEADFVAEDIGQAVHWSLEKISASTSEPNH